ncbi:hypothetical protein GCM10011506_00540 [Marivirga lumbricoides]|uniref:DUF3592 domain-containing protein n=1 Tax=Marivirga lumbricoides TaxID=1046115 RepID=A0ABQ1L9I8_9BACT|nr:hypothetical protein GCM10011506_00540 [Marivirga lumbricoides]
MNYFDFKKRNLISGPHLLGVILIFAGLVALISPAFIKSEPDLARILGVGFGAIIIGFVIIFSYTGTYIDFSEKRFKEYTSIGGYKMGEWDVLPAINTVQVTSSTFKVTNTPNGISPTLSGKVTDFKVRLFSNKSQADFCFVYSSRKRAIKSAEVLVSHLNADLLVHLPNEY